MTVWQVPHCQDAVVVWGRGARGAAGRGPDRQGRSAGRRQSGHHRWRPPAAFTNPTPGQPPAGVTTVTHLGLPGGRISTASVHRRRPIPTRAVLRCPPLPWAHVMPTPKANARDRGVDVAAGADAAYSTGEEHLVDLG